MPSAHGVVPDVIKSVRWLQLRLPGPRFWRDIVPVETYAEYMRRTHPDVAEEIIAKSDKAMVEKFDAVIRKINACIGRRVTTTQQAQKLEALLAELAKAVRADPPSP